MRASQGLCIWEMKKDGGKGGTIDFDDMLTCDGIDVELSLTVPITNSLAFLFTVLGEWWAEGKVISRGEWLPFAGVPYVGSIDLVLQIPGLEWHLYLEALRSACSLNILKCEPLSKAFMSLK